MQPLYRQLRLRIVLVLGDLELSQVVAAVGALACGVALAVTALSIVRLAIDFGATFIALSFVIDKILDYYGLFCVFLT